MLHYGMFETRQLTEIMKKLLFITAMALTAINAKSVKVVSSLMLCLGTIKAVHGNLEGAAVGLLLFGFFGFVLGRFME